MIKFSCASCSEPIENSEARFAMSGNFCDSCNARASKLSAGRFHKESFRHDVMNSKIEGVHFTKKDLAKIQAYKVNNPLDAPKE